MRYSEIQVRQQESLVFESNQFDYVYRTEKADPYFKGKAIWGEGRYFSLTLDECRRINSGTDDDISKYAVPKDFKIKVYDLTWRDSDRSDNDYEELHAMIDKHASDLDAIVIKSNSMQYAFSQMVVFPKSVDRMKLVDSVTK